MSPRSHPALLFASISICFPPVPATAQTPEQQSVTASVDYLNAVMDEFHEVIHVYQDVSSAGNHFHERGLFIGEGGTILSVGIDGSFSQLRHSGATSTRFSLQRVAANNYGGFVFLNGTLDLCETRPSLNFGTVENAGVDLTGAIALTFFARGETGGERVQFFMGGVGHRDFAPFPDSALETKIDVILTDEWQQFTIPLAGRSDLGGVLGGFGWVASAGENLSFPDQIVFFVDEIQYVLDPAHRMTRLNQPRLLRSFTTLPLQPDVTDPDTSDDFDFVLRNSAFVYDNVITLLAYLAEGSPDSQRRARLIGDALIYVSEHDRYLGTAPLPICQQTSPLTIAGHPLRSAYGAGDISLPPGWRPNGRLGTPPATGFYVESRSKFEELVENRQLDTGNNAWAMIGLLALHQRTGVDSYRTAALSIGEFILSRASTSGSFAGFRGGIDEFEGAAPQERVWSSTEHNLDIFAAFSRAHLITGDNRWLEGANSARRFIEQMWDPSLGCFRAGTKDPDTRNNNAGQLPLDVQAWCVLAVPGLLVAHPQTLACAELNHRLTHLGFYGFDFNEDRDGIWVEGTAQMTVAYSLAGQGCEVQRLRGELRRIQMTAGFGDGRGLPAATRDRLTTGFDLITGLPFNYFNRLHISATAWNILAQTGFNPYYQNDAPVSLPAFQMSRPAISGPGSLLVGWPSVICRKYRIESSVNLTSWTPVGSDIVADGSFTTITIPSAGTIGFVRASEFPP